MISKTLKIVLIALIGLSTTLLAEDSKVSKFFDKYSDIDGITYVSVGSLNAKLDNAEINGIMKNINSIKILTGHKFGKGKKGRGDKAGKSINLYNEAVKQLPLKDYEQFLEVKESGTNVKMLYKSVKGKANEFLMLIKEEGESTIIWIDGMIELKDLSKIPHMLGVEKNRVKKVDAKKGGKPDEENKHHKHKEPSETESE